MMFKSLNNSFYALANAAAFNIQFEIANLKMHVERNNTSQNFFSQRFFYIKKNRNLSKIAIHKMT